MATIPAISNALAIILCNAVVDALDGGAGAGYVEVRTGSPPSTVDDAATGTLLVTITLGDPAFGAAADTSPGAAATMNATAGAVNAVATGTPGWFRAYDSNNVGIVQGTVGTASADMIASSATITTGFPVNIVSWVWRQREN